jgi:hypothetical protein
MSNGGKEYRRLIAAVERVFGATIFFGTDTITAKARVVQRPPAIRALAAKYEKNGVNK